MKDREVINLLLLKEMEISNKIHHAVTEIMRLGYESDRGKAQVPDMVDSIMYSLDDMGRILNRDKKPIMLSVTPPESVSEPEKTLSEPEKTERKGRKRIDIGKIMALKNAGWSNIKIADEMGMNPQSVANAIYQHKKKCGSV